MLMASECRNNTELANGRKESDGFLGTRFLGTRVGLLQAVEEI